MKSKNVIEDLKKLLLRGTGKALDGLADKIKSDSDIAQHLVLLRSRYEALIKDHHLQLISSEVKNVELNKIREAYLYLVSRIEEKDIANHVKYPNHSGEARVNIGNHKKLHFRDLSEVEWLSLQRIEGNTIIDLKLSNYWKQEKVNCEVAAVELAIHYYAKFKELKFSNHLDFVGPTKWSTHFGKRTMRVLRCLALLAQNRTDDLLREYREVQKFNKISFQELNYLAFWEGLILVAGKQYESGNAIWNNLSGNSPQIESKKYPFVSITNDFDRAIFKLILGTSEIAEILEPLNIGKLRGAAHVSAVNCRIIRKNEEILRNIIEMGKVLHWKNLPQFQTAWTRLLTYEKTIFSNSGTLFKTRSSANGRALLEGGEV